MTTVEYAVNGVTISFSATGHAAYAKPGEADIVCASVSTLVSLLAELVARAHADDQLRKPPILQLEPGNVRIIVEPRRMFLMELRERFGIILTGLGMLAEQYPNHVRIAHFTGRKGD